MTGLEGVAAAAACAHGRHAASGSGGHEAGEGLCVVATTGTGHGRMALFDSTVALPLRSTATGLGPAWRRRHGVCARCHARRRDKAVLRDLSAKHEHVRGVVARDAVRVLLALSLERMDTTEAARSTSRRMWRRGIRLGDGRRLRTRRRPVRRCRPWHQCATRKRVLLEARVSNHAACARCVAAADALRRHAGAPRGRAGRRRPSELETRPAIEATDDPQPGLATWSGVGTHQRNKLEIELARGRGSSPASEHAHGEAPNSAGHIFMLFCYFFLLLTSGPHKHCVV